MHAFTLHFESLDLGLWRLHFCQWLHAWLCWQGHRGSLQGWKGRRDLFLPSCFLGDFLPTSRMTLSTVCDFLSTSRMTLSTVCDFLSTSCLPLMWMSPHDTSSPGGSSSFLKYPNPVCNFPNTCRTSSAVSPRPASWPPRDAGTS